MAFTAKPPTRWQAIPRTQVTAGIDTGRPPTASASAPHHQESQVYGQDHRHRPRNHQLGRGHHGGRQAHPSSSTRRAAARRRRSWASPRTASASSAPSPSARRSPTPRGRSPRSSASWAVALTSPRRRSIGSPTRSSAGHGRRAPGQDRRQELLPAGDLGDGAAEAQARGRALPRPGGHRGGGHRARLLQRLPAPGHQGRRPHRRARGQAHHQRAHRGGPRLRPRQEGTTRPDHRGLRLRRRHLRHLHPRGGRQRRRGQVDQRRHPPRRRRRRRRSSSG